MPLVPRVGGGHERAHAGTGDELPALAGLESVVVAAEQVDGDMHGHGAQTGDLAELGILKGTALQRRKIEADQPEVAPRFPVGRAGAGREVYEGVEGPGLAGVACAVVATYAEQAIDERLQGGVQVAGVVDAALCLVGGRRLDSRRVL